MRLFNKLLSVIAVFISLAGIAFADGIVFDWQPFIVNDYLDLDHPMKNIQSKNLFVSEEIWGRFDVSDELLHSDLNTKNNLPEVTTKKSALSKIKITFSPGISFMMPSDESYLRGKDGKLSQASRTIPSFFRNPSQDTAVETLKLIEPQINLGFEF